MRRKFYRELAILAILAAILTWATSQADLFAAAAAFSWASAAFFIVLTWIIFVLGMRATTSSNINGLTQVILGIFMVKLICCALIIVAYKQLATPSDHWFVVPFLGLYVIFTSYEVILFNRLNQYDTAVRSSKE